MTLEELRALLIPLALAMRADFDPPTQRAYHRVLKDVPAMLAQAAIEDLEKSGLRFFPGAPEIQSAAEKARRRLIALNPYEPCAECEDSPGFKAIMQGDGWQKTVVPCPCKAAHRARLADIGVLEPLAHMPGETEAQAENSYPVLAQIPTEIRARLTEISTAKLLK